MISSAPLNKHAAWLLFALVISGLFGLMTYVVYTSLVVPRNYANQDFMTLWAGAKAIASGVNPYNPQLWNPFNIQYGATQLPNETAPYPLWTYITLQPLALFNVNVAAAIWIVTSFIFLAVSLTILSQIIGKVRLTLMEFAAIILIACSSRWSILTFLNGQLSMLLLIVIAFFLLLDAQNRPLLAGFTLAFLVLKPTPFVLFTPLFGVYLLIHRRWAVISGAAGGLLVLAGSSWIVQPHWLMAWQSARDKTTATAQTPTLWGLSHDVTAHYWPLLGLILTALIAAIIGYIFIRQKELNMASALSLALSASLLTTPYLWPYDNVMLFVPLAVLSGDLHTRWKHRWGVWAFLIVTCLVLPWWFYSIANRRGIDTFSALIPVFIVVLCLKYMKQSSPLDRVPKTASGRELRLR